MCAPGTVLRYKTSTISPWCEKPWYMSVVVPLAVFPAPNVQTPASSTREELNLIVCESKLWQSIQCWTASCTFFGHHHHLRGAGRRLPSDAGCLFPVHARSVDRVRIPADRPAPSIKTLLHRALTRHGLEGSTVKIAASELPLQMHPDCSWTRRWHSNSDCTQTLSFCIIVEAVRQICRDGCRDG